LIDYCVEGRHCNQGLARYIAVSARLAEEYRGFCAIGGRDKEKTKSKNTVENAKSASKKV